MRRIVPLLLAALLALFMAGCSSSDRDNTNSPGTIPETSTPSTAVSEPPATASGDPSASPSEAASQPPEGNDEAALQEAAQSVVEVLRDRDLSSLSDWIDPEQGLRFSPYSHIDKDNDLTFQAGQLPDFKDQKKLKWGIADGSGEPIELTFRDYYEKFVYDKDFAEAPSVTANAVQAKGTIAFNGAEAYPGASFVEFYFPGFDKTAEGMDWEHLVLVFVPSGEDWKLVSIVHGQWTT